MEEINSPNDVVSHFNNIDGIEAQFSNVGDALVEVNEESAVGAFFREIRVNDLEREATTRNGLEETVLDAWVSLPEEEDEGLGELFG